MATYTRKQGDSLWLDIAGNISLIDSDWNNWSGKWAILDVIGEAPLIEGDLLKISSGVFRFKPTLLEMSSIAVGAHILIMQIENTTADYREEISQDKLVIIPQGISA